MSKHICKSCDKHFASSFSRKRHESKFHNRNELVEKSLPDIKSDKPYSEIKTKSKFTPDKTHHNLDLSEESSSNETYYNSDIEYDDVWETLFNMIHCRHKSLLSKKVQEVMKANPSSYVEDIVEAIVDDVSEDFMNSISYELKNIWIWFHKITQDEDFASILRLKLYYMNELAFPENDAINTAIRNRQKTIEKLVEDIILEREEMELDLEHDEDIDNTDSDNYSHSLQSNTESDEDIDNTDSENYSHSLQSNTESDELILTERNSLSSESSCEIFQECGEEKKKNKEWKQNDIFCDNLSSPWTTVVNHAYIVMADRRQDAINDFRVNQDISASDANIKAAACLSLEYREQINQSLYRLWFFLSSMQHDKTFRRMQTHRKLYDSNSDNFSVKSISHTIKKYNHLLKTKVTLLLTNKITPIVEAVRFDSNLEFNENDSDNYSSHTEGE